MASTPAPVVCQTCGVLAVGTCRQCEQAFCMSHNYQRNYEYCTTCGEVARQERVSDFAKGLAASVDPWDQVVGLVKQLLQAAPGDAVEVVRIDVDSTPWLRRRRETRVQVDIAWSVGTHAISYPWKDMTESEVCPVAICANGKLALFSEEDDSFHAAGANVKLDSDALKNVEKALRNDAARVLT